MNTTISPLTLSDILGTPSSREESLQAIKADPMVYEKFQSFPTRFREQILEFIQGIRGLPILYDSFFKAILNPANTPERLERFLSCLLNQPVTIITILNREGSQLVELGSLVIMDIIVQTADGSYINVEMQKHGYAFSGERSSCYMSDLIMRQYNLVKSEKKNNFSFKDMKPVYLIVLMENSSKNFKAVSPHYIHRSQYSFDTGAALNLLTNYIFVSLDTFHSIGHNISSYLDAWLTFLSSDTPNDIINLVNTYPEFKTYYHDIALYRTNPKELMNMFSEALLQMDKNTANYMIEEMKKEIDTQAQLILEQAAALSEKNATLSEKDAYIKKLEAELAQKE